MNWKKGERVKWKSDEGFVNFIDEEYITICTKEWEKCERILKTSLRPKNQVNIVCYAEYWEDVIRYE